MTASALVQTGVAGLLLSGERVDVLALARPKTHDGYQGLIVTPTRTIPTEAVLCEPNG